jgi:hypothetical protein
MKLIPEAVRTAAFFYALAVLLLGAMLVLSLLDNQPVPWRKVTGISAITMASAVLPLAGFWAGQRLAKSERAKGVVSWGIVIALGLPFVVGLLALLSSEPLAGLALLYAPPLQAVVIGGSLAAAAITKADRP